MEITLDKLSTEANKERLLIFTQSEKIFWALIIFFSAATNLKIADIQLSELSLAAIFLIYFSRIIDSNFKFENFRYLRKLSQHFGYFIILCFILMLANQFQDFYPPASATSFLKKPFILSLVRLSQVLMVLLSFILVSRKLGQNFRHLTFFVKVYILTGLLCSIHAILSYIALQQFGINLLGAYETEFSVRARGLFVEGGPFGLYLVSVFVVIFVYHHNIQKIKFGYLVFLIGTIGIALSLSASKAGLLALVSAILMALVLSKKKNIKVIFLTTFSLGLLSWGLFSFFSEQFIGYFNSYLLTSSSKNSANIDSEDPSVVMGRVAGMIIVPKMIQERPFIGIGIGNYPLIRNDLKYLGSLPTVSGWDLPGLGLFGNTAELGIPLSIYFIIILLNPFLLIRKKMPKQTTLIVAALYPIIAFGLGVQITFLYPWLVLGMTLGITFHKLRQTIQPSPLCH